MGINNKIDEIRSKPEHIRVRYVWGTVAICMLFILVLWIFSVKDIFNSMNIQSESSGSCLTDIKKGFEDQGQETPSIKEIMDQASQRMEEGMIIQENKLQENER